MKITRENYEIFFIDYIEGLLSDEQIKELHTFLENNPDKKEELDLFEDAPTLNNEEIIFEEKETLKKVVSEKMLDLTKTEYLSIAKLENDITEKEEKDLNELLKSEKHIDEYNRIKRTVLKADESIVFPIKSRIKRSVFTPQLKTVMYVAASIIIMFLIVQPIFKSATKHGESLHAIRTNIDFNFKAKENTVTDNNKAETIENKTHNNIKNFNKKEENVSTVVKAENDSLIDKTLEPDFELVYSDNLQGASPVLNNNQIRLTPANADYKVEPNGKPKRIWQALEKSVAVWNRITKGEVELNNKYKQNGSIETFELYTANFAFKKTYK